MGRRGAGVCVNINMNKMYCMNSHRINKNRRKRHLPGELCHAIKLLIFSHENNFMVI